MHFPVGTDLRRSAFKTTLRGAGPRRYVAKPSIAAPLHALSMSRMGSYGDEGLAKISSTNSRREAWLGSRRMESRSRCTHVFVC